MLNRSGISGVLLCLSILTVVGCVSVQDPGFESDGSDPTNLDLAILAADESKVELELDRGATFSDRSDGSSMMYAVWSHQPKMVRFVASKGAPIFGDERDGLVYAELMEEAMDEVDRAALLDSMLDVGLSPCASVNAEDPPSDALGPRLRTASSAALLGRLETLEREC